MQSANNTSDDWPCEQPQRVELEHSPTQSPGPELTQHTTFSLNPQQSSYQRFRTEESRDSNNQNTGGSYTQN